MPRRANLKISTHNVEEQLLKISQKITDLGYNLFEGFANPVQQSYLKDAADYVDKAIRSLMMARKGD